MSGKLFIISAPSCAGKTSLLKAVLKSEYGKHLKQYVTYTSKKPRKGDIEGVDFHFISEKEFKKKIDQGFFLEWSNAYGNYYGTPKGIIDELNAGQSYLIILDRAGAKQIAEFVPDAILIWIYVSDIGQLGDRIKARGLDSKEQIALRLQLAQKEMATEKRDKKYHFHIKNDDFDSALGKFKKIIADTLLLS